MISARNENAFAKKAEAAPHLGGDRGVHLCGAQPEAGFKLRP